MKTIGGHAFPETEQEFKTWKPVFVVRKLHYKVLVVAKTRVEGQWKAYCTPVPGQNHDTEWCLWKTEGTQVLEAYARPMFPEFGELKYAR